ncbi:sulfite exporter TauE/SafE family protein [Nocardioides marmorisolisilvae]|uniref:Probable membrane transporter protein n=1 Tax=Nocardioides marmorisolisilvae TaxID=1542737 RepID=A0A3N0DV13_9ACTN|nr:sulfite exporter TauE/SafE family protein [Nocardioides marmorisolisilvae]RNL79391.1 sulfite exporter TauE/SafE family protein [Nocardioides marmorisolisilvae]
MSLWEGIAILLSGVGAGTINTVVGSGTLITFPTLLAFGLSPVTANVSNTIGLAPGSFSGAWGYRAELRGRGARLLRLGTASLVGGIIGAVLLLVLPSDAFDAIVPALIVLALVLVIAGPRINRWLARRSPDVGERGFVWPAVAGAGVYGGYFGAAQGVLLMAILGIGIDDDLQTHNATKNFLAGIVNGIAAVVFVAVADVDWKVVPLIAVGSVTGAQLGARFGRKLSPHVLRAVIVVVGLAALASFIW